jgi:hypothetical protein
LSARLDCKNRSRESIAGSGSAFQLPTMTNLSAQMAPGPRDTAYSIRPSSTPRGDIYRFNSRCRIFVHHQLGPAGAGGEPLPPFHCRHSRAGNSGSGRRSRGNPSAWLRVIPLVPAAYERAELAQHVAASHVPLQAFGSAQSLRTVPKDFGVVVLGFDGPEPEPIATRLSQVFLSGKIWRLNRILVEPRRTEPIAAKLFAVRRTFSEARSPGDRRCWSCGREGCCADPREGRVVYRDAS